MKRKTTAAFFSPSLMMCKWSGMITYAKIKNPPEILASLNAAHATVFKLLKRNTGSRFFVTDVR